MKKSPISVWSNKSPLHLIRPKEKKRICTSITLGERPGVRRQPSSLTALINQLSAKLQCTSAMRTTGMHVLHTRHGACCMHEWHTRHACLAHTKNAAVAYTSGTRVTSHISQFHTRKRLELISTLMTEEYYPGRGAIEKLLSTRQKLNVHLERYFAVERNEKYDRLKKI